nr:hypothetical protein Iba_chr14dCG2800 [Ipomoea batatas]
MSFRTSVPASSSQVGHIVAAEYKCIDRLLESSKSHVDRAYFSSPQFPASIVCGFSRPWPKSSAEQPHIVRYAGLIDFCPHGDPESLRLLALSPVPEIFTIIRCSLHCAISLLQPAQRQAHAMGLLDDMYLLQVRTTLRVSYMKFLCLLQYRANRWACSISIRASLHQPSTLHPSVMRMRPICFRSNRSQPRLRQISSSGLLKCSVERFFDFALRHICVHSKTHADLLSWDKPRESSRPFDTISTQRPDHYSMPLKMISCEIQQSVGLAFNISLTDGSDQST